MNILIDALPKSVTIDGNECPVNYGFRALILVEICIFDDKLTEEQRVLNALNIFYKGQIPISISRAIEMLMWFYRGGKSQESGKIENNKYKSIKRYYDFNQDANYIYSAYLSQYGVDLQDLNSDDLHWWKFKAMFDGLDEKLKFCKIMSYRAIPLDGMSKGQKVFYNKMKKIYALKNDAAVDNKLDLAKRNQQMLDYVNNRFKGMPDGKK